LHQLVIRKCKWPRGQAKLRHWNQKGLRRIAGAQEKRRVWSELHHCRTAWRL